MDKIENIQYFSDALKRIIPYIEKFKDRPNLEIEFRLGRLETDGTNNIFNASVSEEFFKDIVEVLETNPNWDSKNRGILNDYFNNGIRMSVHSDGKKSCIKKIKLVSLDFEFTDTPFDIRVSLSQEIPKTIEEFMVGIDGASELNENDLFKREKDRMSYRHQAWSFDITTVKTIENSVPTIQYEVELETVNINILESMSMQYFVHSSLLKIKDMINMCETVPEDSVLDFIQVKENRNI
jgi:hypothetical protein